MRTGAVKRRKDVGGKGIKEGIKEGIGALIKLCKNFQVSRQETLQKILESFSLPQQEAEEYLAMYW